MKKYLQPDEKRTFCRADKKGSVCIENEESVLGQPIKK